jgi:hypothetical protein
MADALASGASALNGRAGSTPASDTTWVALYSAGVVARACAASCSRAASTLSALEVWHSCRGGGGASGLGRRALAEFLFAFVIWLRKYAASKVFRSPCVDWAAVTKGRPAGLLFRSR